MIMVDPKTNFQKFFTRDITWLKRNYYQPSSKPKNGWVLNIVWLTISNNDDIDCNNDEDPDNDDNPDVTE